MSDKKINLEEILKQYLTLENVRANKPDYTFNMVLSAMKEACRQALELAAENAELTTTNVSPEVTINFKTFWRSADDYDPEYWIIVDSESILNTIKQIE